MKKLLWFSIALSLPLSAQQYKIAVIGLVHGHAWGHLPRMAKSEVVKLVGISEPNPDLIAEAKKKGLDPELIHGNDMESLAKEVMVQPAEVIALMKKVME